MNDIVIVGPCGAGKTTLARSLKAAGYSVRAVAQEHSVIRKLWRHGGEPAAVVFLDAEAAVITQRRQHDFPLWLHAEQQLRLADARENALIVVDTSNLAVAEVRALVTEQLVAYAIVPK